MSPKRFTKATVTIILCVSRSNDKICHKATESGAGAAAAAVLVVGDGTC